MAAINNIPHPPPHGARAGGGGGAAAAGEVEVAGAGQITGKTRSPQQVQKQQPQPSSLNDMIEEMVQADMNIDIDERTYQQLQQQQQQPLPAVTPTRSSGGGDEGEGVAGQKQPPPPDVVVDLESQHDTSTTTAATTTTTQQNSNTSIRLLNHDLSLLQKKSIKKQESIATVCVQVPHEELLPGNKMIVELAGTCQQYQHLPPFEVVVPSNVKPGAMITVQVPTTIEEEENGTLMYHPAYKTHSPKTDQ